VNSGGEAQCGETRGTESGKWGAGMSVVRRGELLALLYGRKGEQGGRTGKGIDWPVVAASMPVVRFAGEWKRRGEWGVKRGGGSAAPFLGEEGMLGW
jgi:hypothetical protein